ncbi:MAG: rod shape-determining protein MreD [Prevotellaceae bacterium]|nr:rod shape-determining protein MreD [Prevotellaceae bacterium]
MISILFNRLLAATGLFLLQILVFNHVHIMGYATPFPYIFLLLITPLNAQRWVVILFGFLAGLTADIFTGTIGMQAVAGTLLGFVQPVLLKYFKPVSADEEIMVPSSKVLGWGAFLRYSFTCSLLFCAVFFALESFDLLLWQALLINIAGSTVLTTAAIVFFEAIHGKV